MLAAGRSPKSDKILFNRSLSRLSSNCAVAISSWTQDAISPVFL
jgi:hypothetical protein